MMSAKVNPISYSAQQLESDSPPSQAPQVGEHELTDDEMIDAAAAWILETYREAFLELVKRSYLELKQTKIALIAQIFFPI